MDMDFRVQVWQRVWKMTFFGLKEGQDLRTGPHTPTTNSQEFPRIQSKYMFDVLLLKSKRPTRIVF